MFGGLPLDWVRRQSAGAVRQGVSFDTLMADSLIEIRHGDNRDVIGPGQFLLLCINTVLSVEDAAHGLANTAISPRYPAIGLRVALGCGTLEGAINSLSRLYSSASQAVRIKLETNHDAAILSVHVEASRDVDAVQLEENYLIWMFMHCMHFLGRPLPVNSVSVRDPFHFNMGRTHFGIGGCVSHGEVTAFRFARRLLEAPPANCGGDNIQWQCHQLWLDSVACGPPERTASAFVSGGEFVRLQDLAEQSGVSTATLRRRLQPSEGGFRDTRQRALVEAATRRLIADEDSVDQIAVELGYSDARSFRRFLKQATGHTPQQIRTRAHTDWISDDHRILDKLKTLSAQLNI